MGSFIIGCRVLFTPLFVDEADNLATGLLLSRGYVLYRDIFSHHFPFAYYWMACIAGLFGPSLLAARLSILLFQVVSFAWAMRLTHFYVPMGLASLAWNIIGHFSRGNTVLYSNLSCVALSCVFVVTLAMLVRPTSPARKELLTLGGFSAIAILSDPLSIYAVSVLLLVLLVSRARLDGIISILLVVAMALGVWFGYLLITNTFPDFYRDVIFFNSRIYGKYVNTDPVRLGDILRLALSLFDIFDTKQWAVPALFYRLTIVLVSAVLLIRGRVLLAGFIYFFAIALFMISPKTFRSNGFILVSLLAATWFVASELGQAEISPVPSRSNGLSPYWPGSSLPSILRLLQQASRIVTGFMLVYLLINGIKFILNSSQTQLSYKASIEVNERMASFIANDLTCGHRDVALAFYPAGPAYNFLTGMPPVSRYLFMWPWVAEIAVPDVIDRLESGHAVVYLDLNEIVWGKYQSRDFLSDLKVYLDANYEVRQGFYVAPDLIQECHPISFSPEDIISPDIPSGELVKGVKFSQTFESQCAGLNQLELYLGTYGRVNTSSVIFRLTDLEDHQRVFEQVVAGTDIRDDKWHRLFFEPLLDSRGRHYRIVLLSPDGQEGDAITIWRSQTDTYLGGEAFTNDRPVNADLVFRYSCSR
jgi:hypothetical protein